MKKIKYIMLFISILLLYCCDINMKFDKEDKNWVNIYKKEDTLIFSSKKYRDTIHINYVEIKNANVDVMSSSYNPICANIDYTDSTENTVNLFSICKEEPGIPTWVGFNFKKDKGRIRDIHSYPESELNFNGEKRKGYMFKPYKKDKPSFWWDEEYGVRNPHLEYFFWDREYGIIEYKTIQGEIFRLDKFLREGKNILQD